ncbi:MAG: alanine racemase [Tissierellia bacterium]|nr:alanine racemase [Tissierellia bacterium]
MKYKELTTPALLIDEDVLLKNLKRMQDFANKKKVNLRPHTKTHKMPYIAKLQTDIGANGIAVAKTGEAKTMYDEGFDNILIANEIVSKEKLEAIKKMNEDRTVLFGVDSIDALKIILEVFDKTNPAKVLVEIEVGENRSGVIEKKDFIELIKFMSFTDKIQYKGVFSHDGNSYSAKDLNELENIHLNSQKRTLEFVNLAKNIGFNSEIVSIGSTPPMICEMDILEGITEIRPGTYALMDASQSNVIGNYDQVAATVLATVISKPTAERTILDVGAKGITMQSRKTGITNSNGMGKILEYPDVFIDKVYDEHAIIYNREFRDKVKIGEKVRIIVAHICPTVNLYDKAHFIKADEIIYTKDISARGKLW